MKKLLQSYILMVATCLVISLYLITSFDKRKQLSEYQQRLDSTAILLDKISKIQSQNQIKKIKISNPFFDAKSIFDFDTLVSPFTDDIKTSLASKLTTSFLGSTKASTIFGVKDYCMFSVEFKDIQLKIQLNKLRNSVKQSLIQTYTVEKIVKCEMNFEPKKPHIQFYNLQSFKIHSDSIKISFTPSESNQPKCNALFLGKIDNNKITGTLTWQRYDMNENTGYNYKLSTSIILK